MLDKIINMRRAIDSPFSPGSDTVPQVWAGRVSQLADWRDVLRPRRLLGVHERGRTILGEAGTGKSALVRRICQDAQSRGDWVTPQLRMASGADPLKRLAAALLGLAESVSLAAAREDRIAATLRRVESVAVAGASLSLRQGEAPEPHVALTELLVEVGREALRRGETMVVIHIDEVQNIGDENALSQLLIALGDALSHEEQVEAPGRMLINRALPIVVYLSGLPEFADLAGARTGATFARRFQVVNLSSISDGDLEAALQPFVSEGWPVPNQDGGLDRVFMTPQAQGAIVELACGEPFLFQLAGQGAWFAGASDLITVDDVYAGWAEVAHEAEAHVLRILDRLPAREREFLEAMGEVEPERRTLKEIAAAAGFKSSSAAGPSAQRLDIVRGLISRGPAYGFRRRAVEAYLTSDWPRPGAPS